MPINFLKRLKAASTPTRFKRLIECDLLLKKASGRGLETWSDGGIPNFLSLGAEACPTLLQPGEKLVFDFKGGSSEQSATGVTADDIMSGIVLPNGIHSFCLREWKQIEGWRMAPALMVMPKGKQNPARQMADLEYLQLLMGEKQWRAAEIFLKVGRLAVEIHPLKKRL